MGEVVCDEGCVFFFVVRDVAVVKVNNVCERRSRVSWVFADSVMKFFQSAAWKCCVLRYVNSGVSQEGSCLGWEMTSELRSRMGVQ